MLLSTFHTVQRASKKFDARMRPTIMADHISNSKNRNQKSYNRALHVLARMRRTGETLTTAARAEHTDPRTVRRYLNAEMRTLAEGQITPTRTDRRQRRMLIPTALGTTPLTIRGSKQASQLGRYMSAVGKYLRTGDVDALAEFEGKSIAGHVLITDPDMLSSL